MRRVYLSNTDRKIFGVCGGIAEAYDIDPTLVRLACIFFCLVTAILPLGLTYLAAWLIMPKQSG